MLINVIKRKASSYKDLSKEQIEIGHPETMLDALVTLHHQQVTSNFASDSFLNQAEIEARGKSGKIAFEHVGKKPDDRHIKERIIADFEDGLFRVFYNDLQITDLTQKMIFNEDGTLVIVKFIMLAGRMW